MPWRPRKLTPEERAEILERFYASVDGCLELEPTTPCGRVLLAGACGCDVCRPVEERGWISSTYRKRAMRRVRMGRKRRRGWA